jgi:choline dehydrogenase-like flavoprotein
MGQIVSQPDDYDLVVLGTGEAGKYLAWTLASQGKRVAVIRGRRHERLPPRTRGHWTENCRSRRRRNLFPLPRTILNRCFPVKRFARKKSFHSLNRSSRWITRQRTEHVKLQEFQVLFCERIYPIGRTEKFKIPPTLAQMGKIGGIQVGATRRLLNYLSLVFGAGKPARGGGWMTERLSSTWLSE